jgi:hypothetical protein
MDAMTDTDDYADDLDDGYEPDPDDFWDDRDEQYEPDPEDAEFARAYAEHLEHCETRHGGGDCDCRPSRLAMALVRLRDAASDTAWRLRGAWFSLLRSPHFLRLGPLELSVRIRRKCGVCSGRGWMHSKGTLDPHPAPPGYDGVSLCGCGSAIGKLGDSARYLRAERRRSRTEPPF